LPFAAGGPAEAAKEGAVRGGDYRLATSTLLPVAERGLRRREFIALLGGAAAMPVAWPLAAGAQQPGKLPTIGFLGATTPTVWSSFVGAFLKRLRELGWVDGRNIAIEYRWAEGREDRYAEFAAEFVRLKVNVIVTAGTGAVIAAKSATSQIPIVFAAAGDPVGNGLVASLPHPGGNVTGLSNQQTDLAGHRLEVLREVVPGLRRVAVMGNVDTPVIPLEMDAVAAAATKLGLDAFRLEVRNPQDIVPGIESLRGRADALYVCTDPFITTQRVRINTLAISEKLPTMNAFREYVQAGGLLSYGPSFAALFARSADFVDKILRGAKPADIPVEQPVKFDLIVNLTTAKALGLTIPESFLSRADEVIE
jgi:putative tryptophan/tyrosine transport system substrate-binding protein